MNRHCLLAQSACQSYQNAMNPGLLFIQQTDKLIVLLDSLKRLDEDSLARRRRAVNDARNSALELGFNRNHEAVATNRDEIVLRASALAQPAKRSAKTLLDS